MDKVAEAISQIFPLSRLFERLGLSKEVSASLSILTALLIVYVLARFVKAFIKKSEWHRAAMNDLKPQFDYLSVKKARQFYIPTQYQNASPSRQEEPGFTHKYIARNKLIPFFISTAFKEEADSERFYLILADSGMGKTTFMVNLYLKYHSFFSRRRRHKMKLFRFSNPDTVKNIRAIEDKDAVNTILLLDALDEDQGILSTDPAITDEMAFRKRVDEVIEVTRNFREVVITCRTQYFPGQEDDPYELKIKRPDERGYYTLNKLYLSPFNDKEVKKYLGKKFGRLPFLNREKKKRALRVVSQSHNLVMRPMLLSYIDYLIGDDLTYATSGKIYQELVSKWLLREAEKRKGLEDREEFISNLNELSRQLAIRIYGNWMDQGRMYVTKEEAYAIAKQHQIELKPEEITGQSLLTCDGVANWKFAHKSILEFFLAHEAHSNPKFLRYMSFHGMDMAQRFYEELNPQFIIVENRLLRSELPEVPFHHDFYIYLTPVAHEGVRFWPAMMNKTDEYTLGLFELYYLKGALDYCNQLNKKHGYPLVYDEAMNMIDPQGRITKDPFSLRGFRLPTQVEWGYVFYLCRKKRIELFRTRNVIYFRAQITGSVMPVENDPAVTEKYSLIFTNIGEWCFDQHGATVRGGVEDGSPKSINMTVLDRSSAESRFHARLIFVP